VGGRGVCGGGEQGEEMTQTMYAHVNNWTKKSLNKGTFKENIKQYSQGKTIIRNFYNWSSQKSFQLYIKNWKIDFICQDVKMYDLNLSLHLFI
jgi:trehalose/maltose hydrolase-like predicted phosphorylase